jgi:hypothetical protein
MRLVNPTVRTVSVVVLLTGEIPLVLLGGNGAG